VDYIRVYDKDLKLLANLENAFNVGYELRLNEVWKASFKLPVSDPKAQYCQPFNFVEIFDNGERVELFRIMPYDAERTTDGNIMNFECEHVLATLLDDPLFKLHELLSMTTTQVIQYILSKQTVSRWQLGTCGFNRGFDYKYENDNLLNALFSVPKLFTGEYQWTFDTTSYPWTINLIEPSTTVEAYIRYRKNLQGIKKTVDPTNLITRIYPLGSGEGVNQLDITKENGGVPYLDADTIGTWGIISKVWVDKRYERADSLKSAGSTILEQCKNPLITYAVEVVDMHLITNDPIDKFRLGAMVGTYDDEMNIDIVTRVTSKSKGDVFGDPGAAKLEISNNIKDISDAISSLRQSQIVNETYSQGATNIDTSNYTDNCDAEHPAVFKLYISDETVRVNKVKLAYNITKFRAYSKATQGGGATSVTSSAGGGTTQTSSSGGGSTQTSSSGGGSTQTSTSGGGGTQTSSAGGGSTETTDTQTFVEAHLMTGVPENSVGTENWGYHLHELVIPGDLFEHGHTVTIPNHTHSVTIPSHTHDVSIPAHTHSVSIPSHTHDVTIPDHTHEITIPDHTHEIEYGIFEGPDPSSITMKIDGNTVPNPSLSNMDLDIIPYLSKDADGRVKRGEWHTIEITPNDLARVELSAVIQCYVRSKGGGDF